MLAGRPLGRYAVRPSSYPVTGRWAVDRREPSHRSDYLDCLGLLLGCLLIGRDAIVQDDLMKAVRKMNDAKKHETSA
jgi:hypothetical protein